MRSPGDVITAMVNAKTIEEVDECAVSDKSHVIADQMLVSMAISLKRIADALGEGSPFLAALAGTLDDASHNHQQRMRNV